MRWNLLALFTACFTANNAQTDTKGPPDNRLLMSLACPNRAPCGEHLLNCEPHGVVSVRGAIQGYKAPDFQPHCLARDLCAPAGERDPCCKYSNSSDCLQVMPQLDLELLHGSCEGRGHCLFRSQYLTSDLCQVTEGYVPYSAIAYVCVNRSALLNPTEDRSLVGQEVHIFYPGRHVSRPLTESSPNVRPTPGSIDEENETATSSPTTTARTDSTNSTTSFLFQVADGHQIIEGAPLKADSDGLDSWSQQFGEVVPADGTLTSSSFDPALSEYRMSLSQPIVKEPPKTSQNKNVLVKTRRRFYPDRNKTNAWNASGTEHPQRRKRGPFSQLSPSSDDALKRLDHLYQPQDDKADTNSPLPKDESYIPILDVTRRAHRSENQDIAEKSSFSPEQAAEVLDLPMHGEGYLCKVNSVQVTPDLPVAGDTGGSLTPDDIQGGRVKAGTRERGERREEVKVSVMYLRMVGTQGCTKVSVADRSQRAIFRCTDNQVTEHEGKQVSTMTAPLDVHIRFAASRWEDDFVWIKFSSVSGRPLTIACHFNTALASDPDKENTDVDWYVVFSGLAVTGSLFALFFVAALAYILYRRRRLAGSVQRYNVERQEKAKKRSPSVRDSATYSPRSSSSNSSSSSAPNAGQASTAARPTPTPPHRQKARQVSLTTPATVGMSPLTLHMARLRQQAQAEEDEAEKQEAESPSFHRQRSPDRGALSGQIGAAPRPTTAPSSSTARSTTKTPGPGGEIEATSTYPILSFPALLPPHGCRSPFARRSPRPARIAPSPPFSPSLPPLPVEPDMTSEVAATSRSSPIPGRGVERGRVATKRAEETGGSCSVPVGASPESSPRAVPIPQQRSTSLAFIVCTPIIPGKTRSVPEVQAAAPVLEPSSDSEDEEESEEGPFSIYTNFPLVTDLDEEHLDFDSHQVRTRIHSPSAAQPRPWCTTEEDGASLTSDSLDFDHLEDRVGVGIGDEEEGREADEDSRSSSNSSSSSTNGRKHR